jgi:hypothetical protein
MRLGMNAIALYVTVGVTAGLMGVGCAPTVQAPAVQAPAVQVGLANAPALGGTRIADTRVHDVISNGPDSCGRRLDPNAGPLRYRLPPCQGESVSTTVSSSASTSVSTTATAPVAWVGPDDATSQEWMEHYHFGWPCKPSKPQALKGRMVLAWSPVLSPPERACGLQ